MSIAMILAFLIHLLCYVSPIFAQDSFVYNHKQLMHILGDWESIIATAIAKNTNWQQSYAMAGIIEPSSLNNNVKRPFLSKLGSNVPEWNPFPIKWTKTYMTPEEPNELSNLDIRTNDVLYTNNGEYVIAGIVVDASSGPSSNSAFLLRTDGSGNPIVFRRYQDMTYLKSVAEHPDGEGFVAVGRSNQDNGFQAAILSVDLNLDPICCKTIKGLEGERAPVNRRRCHTP